jgi:hypothetical protein
MSGFSFCIDCKEEEQRFEALLRFEGPARVMAIRAPGASGKSHFTKRLRSKCVKAAEPVPVAFVDFSVFRETDTVALTRRLAHELKALSFKDFERLVRDYYMRSWSSVRGLSDLRGANLANAQGISSTGVNVNAPAANSLTLNTSNIQLETQAALDAAAEECVATFFDTLVEHCRERPAVIIFDTYEQCDPSLRSWFEDELERRLSTETWPASLVVVVAARDDIETFGSTWPETHRAKHVMPVDELGVWRPEDIEDGFREVGLAELPQETPQIVGWLERGVPPGVLVGLMQAAAGLAAGHEQ